MAIVEKKYLLKDSINILLKDTSTKKIDISQFYTQVEMCKEIRYRHTNIDYYKTVRIGHDIKKNELDEQISKKQFKKSKAKMLGQMLKKEHFDFIEDGLIFSISRYKKQLKNIYMLEVTFKTLEDATTFILPDSIKPYILKEVSHDDRYRDKNLALLGNPNKHPYNIYAIFKDIEQRRLHDICAVIFPEMTVSDAVRIALFKLYQSLKNDNEQLIHHGDIRALERFRNNLNHIKILLEEYRFMFDKAIHKKILLHLTMVKKTIATGKDLLVIRSNLNLLESAFNEKEVNSFISRIDKRIDTEKMEVKKFFKTREFTIIFRQFDLLLKEKSNIYPAYYANTTIELAIKKSVRKRYKKLLQLSKKYDKCHDEVSYKKIEKALKQVSILLDNFSCLYEKETHVKMQKLLRILEKKLGEFINLQKRTLIIKTYISHSDKASQEQTILLEKIRAQRLDMEEKLNKEIEDAIAILKENKSLFSK